MTISRRELLRRASLLGVSAALGCASDDASGDGTEGTGGTDDSSGSSGSSSDGADSSSTGDDGLPQYEYDGEPGPETLFSHSVASGDPLLDAVILWSRVTGAPEGDVEAFFEVALDPEFTQRVAADYVMTGPDRDYTIKVDATGLQPGTTYYYRFFALGRTSPIGRTRTAPSPGVQRLRMAVMSCSSLADGYFHAYRRVGERADLDLVIHLGDYIYEYASGGAGAVRPYEPVHEIVTLEDYRMRYAQYRRDADLQECHRQHPMVAVWDDHEITNNAWSDGAENHQPDEGDYGERKSVAYRCYAEWMPFREGAEGIIYRSLPFGDLVALIMLDTRIVGREEQIVSVFEPEGLDDPERQLLGAEQEAWLAGALDHGAVWTVLGQQVMMAHLRLGANPVNLDQWDGYPAARTRLFDLLREYTPNDVVVLTGDIHSSWAFELADDPFGPDYDPSTGAGAVAVEFVAPAVTSEGFPADTAAQFMEFNPHLKWGNLVDRGYIVLDVTPERLQSSWWHVADVTTTTGGDERFSAAYSVLRGVTQLVADAEPAAPPADAPALAP